MTDASRPTAQQFDLEGILAPTAAVDAYMAKFVDSRPLPRNLHAAISYSLLGGGKRLRPVLCIRACQAVGGAQDQAMPPAAAIEMIHCFSLIHDDLPAMDDDDMRRGRPTLHKHTNEAMAILAGDLLNCLPFELIASQLPADLAGRIVLELATATNDMIAGQVYDTLPDFPADMSPLHRLQTIHRNKTGALIRCACRMGAMCGRADEQRLAAVTRYGEAIGLMFQVVDDLLDITQTSEHLGKTAGKDVEQGKMTYPSVMGIDASRAEVTRLQAEAHAGLDALPDNEGVRMLRDLCDYMAVRSK
jgi:geranylgeranyl pyrophosphate synthase